MQTRLARLIGKLRLICPLKASIWSEMTKSTQTSWNSRYLADPQQGKFSTSEPQKLQHKSLLAERQIAIFASMTSCCRRIKPRFLIQGRTMRGFWATVTMARRVPMAPGCTWTRTLWCKRAWCSRRIKPFLMSILWRHLLQTTIVTITLKTNTYNLPY